MKIGELVKTYIIEIFNYCEKEDPSEFSRLMDYNYSNKTFAINFAFCQESAKISDEKSKRYWTTLYATNGKKVRVTSQWVMRSKYNFLNYLLDKQIINQLKYNELDQKVQHDTNKKHIKSINNKSLVRIINNEDEIESVYMSKQYEKFYCLEKSIRKLIRENLESKYGDNWWKKVDYNVQENVRRNLDYELDTSHTKRSEHKIDYTTFGDLRKIINSNWDVFSDRFNRNLNSVNEVMIDLNRLRVPIAHCTPLAEKEITRLEIRLDDWNALLKDI